MLFDKESQFASTPFKSFDVLHPAETKECKIAIRNADADGNPKSELQLNFAVSYSDGLGMHDRGFELTFFGTQMEWESTGIVFERPFPLDQWLGITKAPDTDKPQSG